ncbi:hypothetical protein EXN66_Car006073 [Channa argus]|uniref:Uncharacterized protein n=1 Tax=Channa argus TaxID=215402 RepID=A0A6G1PJC3_CHAAH|nr:hypothetical protein EXN66_Car006073 [Channa argus]
MNKKYFPPVKWAIDICEVGKAKMWTVAEFNKLKKQILQTLIVPSVMCQNHSAAEILPVAEAQKPEERQRSGGRASNSPRHYSAGYHFELGPVKIFRSHTNLQVLEQIL